MALFHQASSVLTQLIAKALKGKRRRNMHAARKITLEAAGWTSEHQAAWEQVKKGLEETIITAYRDRRLRACLFTDASSEGWAYTITQCEPGELTKPWKEQQHELL